MNHQEQSLNTQHSIPLPLWGGVRGGALGSYFTSSDWEGLTRHLSRLSNAEFRKAEQTVRTSLLPTLSVDQYWTAMRHLVLYRKSAFITGLVALEHYAASPAFSLLTDEAKQFSTAINTSIPEAAAKAINIALPLLTTERQIEELFTLFSIDDPKQRVLHLAKVESPLAYYSLFKTLKMLPDNALLVRQCCVHIMRRGNDMATNMATILRAYFDLADISISTSLGLSTYELSYLDRNIDTFLNILNGKRPKV